VKFVLPGQRKRGVFTVTDARRSMSEDISYRQRRYLISMGVRVVAFLLAVFLFHGVWRFIAAAIALVVPYFAVVFANGGREPGNAAAFESFEPNLPDRRDPAGGPLAARDNPSEDGGTGEAAAGDASSGDGSSGDGSSADGSSADASSGNGANGRGGEAFMSGGQADTRSQERFQERH
jgi:hypothetical protein